MTFFWGQVADPGLPRHATKKKELRLQKTKVLTAYSLLPAAYYLLPTNYEQVLVAPSYTWLSVPDSQAKQHKELLRRTIFSGKIKTLCAPAYS